MYVYVIQLTPYIGAFQVLRLLLTLTSYFTTIEILLPYIYLLTMGIEPATSEARGERSDHYATEAPMYRV